MRNDPRLGLQDEEHDQSNDVAMDILDENHDAALDLRIHRDADNIQVF